MAFPGWATNPRNPRNPKPHISAASPLCHPRTQPQPGWGTDGGSWTRFAGAVLWFPPSQAALPDLRLSALLGGNWKTQALGQQIFAGGKKRKEKEMVWLALDVLPAARNSEKSQGGSRSYSAPIFRLLFSIQGSSLSTLVPVAIHPCRWAVPAPPRTVDLVTSPVVSKVTTT